MSRVFKGAERSLCTDGEKTYKRVWTRGTKRSEDLFCHQLDQLFDWSTGTFMTFQTPDLSQHSTMKQTYNLNDPNPKQLPKWELTDSIPAGAGT